MIELKNITKKYQETEVLKNISLKFPQKGLVAILGHSGSGKSTLLNIIGGLTKPSNGDIIIANKKANEFKEKDWDSYRNNLVGFVFQNYQLIDHLSVVDNIFIKIKIGNKKISYKKIHELLNYVGLINKKNAYPNQLSGGEKQRVAIARALVNEPEIILADEPTGALDSKTSIEIMNLFSKIAQTKLVIMVTHNEKLAKLYANYILMMQDGKITNKLNIKDKKSRTINFRKTKLSFKTALKLSLKNIISKKFRFMITALATSIGLIGIIIILAISRGFNNQIAMFEKEAMANYPIIIQNGLITKEIKKQNITNNTDDLIVNNNITDKYYENKINNNYLEYLSNINYKNIASINYQYPLNYVINLNNYKQPTTNINMFGIDQELFSEEFKILAGSTPKNEKEIMLIVNENKEISVNLIKSLSLKQDRINAAEIINQKLSINNNNLKIVGVGILKDDSVIGTMQFNNDKDNYVYINTLDKKINKDNLPQTIYIYPKDFNGKEYIVNYLSKNKDVIFNDYAKELTETTKELIKMITGILVMFSSISLLVSSLMISIIIYISVLERQKEIGILRSLGTRRKDIRKIFKAEGIIIGIISSIISLGISYLLTTYINKLLFKYLEISNIAQINIDVCLLVFSISIILTLISSLIPACIASKKDTVISLAK